ncbi:hypothetical protein SteCoe_2259 [Stentor coeruleus]|uniref:LITAF domain-containing protein n=1 Tax=Stentor coeruleus TaxID=5963 RepID=A0A1R2D021_9CILI|nr:hypothetical protein SteCoe_2259 [Stentor coeruleus]
MEESEGLNNIKIEEENGKTKHHSKKKTSLEVQREIMKNTPKNIDCEKCKKKVWTNYSYHLGKTAKVTAVILAVFAGCCCLCCIPLCNKKFREIRHHCPKCKALLAVDEPFSNKTNTSE